MTLWRYICGMFVVYDVAMDSGERGPSWCTGSDGIADGPHEFFDLELGYARFL